MTVFDFNGWKSALEAQDAERLLGYYTPGFEHIEIDADAPPRSPRKSGEDNFRGAVEGAKKAGIKFRADNSVVGTDRAACSIYCDLPDGRTMTSNTIFDLRDGKIARQLDVQVLDPEG